jgi:hypothetical protein
MQKTKVFIILSMLFSMAGCTDFGKVDQGRVIAYDKDAHTITMIRDKSQDSKKTDYTELPPVSYKLPENPDEMGPEPKVGRLMKIDLEKKEAVIFVPDSNTLASVSFTPVEEKTVDSKDPLVYDSATKKSKAFPVMDPDKKTITTYLKKRKILLTLSVPDEYYAMGPEAWTSGDEVRIYYKEPGKSLRFMNVSKTDIFKK